MREVTSSARRATVSVPEVTSVLGMPPVLLVLNKYRDTRSSQIGFSILVSFFYEKRILATPASPADSNIEIWRVEGTNGDEDLGE